MLKSSWLLCFVALVCCSSLQLIVARVACAEDPVERRHLALLVQEPREKPTQSTGSAGSAKNDKIDAEMEAKILQFAGAQEPKLLELMKFLKQRQPAAYQQALREMSRGQQRLESLAQRDEELHAVESELWQLKAKLRLTAAEISVAKKDSVKDLEAKLESLAEDLEATEIARLKILRDRAADQLKQLQEQILARESGQDEQVKRIIKSWQSRIRKQSSNAKPVNN